MNLPPILQITLNYIEEKTEKAFSFVGNRIPRPIQKPIIKVYNATSEYIEKNPCKSSLFATIAEPFIGGFLLNKCVGSLQTQPQQTISEQIKPDISAAGRFLREQIRAQQSTVPESEKVICVGSTIINGQELTTPVDLRKPETDDPLGECVNSNGFKSKKLGYVSPADLDEARRIHRLEVEEAKQKLIQSWRHEYVLQISSQPAPTCE